MSAVACDAVASACQGKASFATCYTQRIRTCSRSRVQNPNFNKVQINVSSEGCLNTSYGHRVRVPSEALRRSRGNGDSESVDMITSVLSSDYFQSNGTSILERQVLGVWVGHQDVSHLSQPISIAFRRTHPTNASAEGQCVFWDDSKGNWSTEGCESTHSDEDYVCSCDHLSFFAVMMIPPDGALLSPNDLLVLSYLHLCGSITTTILAALTCLMYLRHRKRKLDHSSSIHLQLALALLLLHVNFLISAGWARHTQDQPITALCQILGAGLHWALLAAFSWMAVEGFHLYLLLVRVFNIYIHRYLLKLGLFGWGLPTVTVIACAALGAYGPYSMTNDTRNSTSLCWLQADAAGWRGVCVSVLRYLTVHVYLGVLLLGNGIMLVLTASKLCGRSFQPAGKHGDGHRSVCGDRGVCRDAASLFVLSCALGLPWALAFCSYGPLTHTTIYLFTILNALQGVFVFLWVLAATCRWNQQAKSFSSQTTIKMSSLGQS
ncbi:hypothetical protein ACEWY4_027443 [Coilia grayii]|uniref:Uncharacterized protein n=1 Tax=Coilia grayii TaxID=363190 RepID=A0ABD1IPL4_9TELE